MFSEMQYLQDAGQDVTEFDVRNAMYQDVRNALKEEKSTELVVKTYCEKFPQYSSILENDYLEDAAMGFPSDEELAAGPLPPDVQEEIDAVYGSPKMVDQICRNLISKAPDLIPVLGMERQVEDLDKARIFTETTGVSL